MKLPDIDYSAPVQETSSAIARVGAAQRQLFDTMSAGAEAFGRELVRTQTEKAKAELEEGLAADEAELGSKRYLPVQAVQTELGDAFEQLPAELRAQRQVVKVAGPDGQEREVEVLPTYLVAGAIFSKRAKARVERAAQGIPGQGWQAEFQTAAQRDVAVRGARFALSQAQAMHADLRLTQKAVVDQYVRAGAWGEALGAIDRSQAFEPGEKASLREDVLAAKQKTETVGAKVQLAAQVEARSSAIVGAARIPGYAWVEPAKALAAVEAIPNDDPAKDEVRKLVEHQVEQQAKLKKLAGDDMLNRARAILNRNGDNLADPRLAPIKAWMDDEHNGAAGLWDTLERGVRAERRAAKTSTAEERREQRALDNEAIATFEAIVSLKDRVAVNVDTEYPDASREARAKIRARQARAKRAFDKGLDVDFDEFAARVRTVVQGLEKEDGPRFVEAMNAWYFGWIDDPKHATERPPAAEVTNEIARQLERVKVSWGRDRPRFKQDNPAAEPLPAKEQDDPRARARREREEAATKAASAPGGPKRVKTVEEARALPKGTRFIDPDGVERVR